MKRFLCLLQCVILSLSAQTWAITDDQGCEAKSQQIRGEARNSYLKSCLAQASSPAHVRAVAEQNKRNLCEQNARNMKLESVKKYDYMNDCLYSNVAAKEANKVNANAPALVRVVIPAPSNPPPTVSHTVAPKEAVTQKAVPQKAAAQKAVTQKSHKSSKRSCSQRAKQKGLKGDARKKFMSDCTKG